MNTEGIEKWHADAIILNKDANQTVEQSVFDQSKVKDDFKKAASLKQQGVIVSNKRKEENALLFGVTSHSFLVPKLVEGHQVKKTNDVVIDQTLKDKGFKVGDTLSLSQSDEKLKVVGITEVRSTIVSPVDFYYTKRWKRLCLRG